MLRRLRRIGPGALVAAAFIGPGTVTTATLAGARFGVALLWALGFSVAATLVLQEMAARLGVVTGRGLGEAVRERFENPASRFLAATLVISAIVIGNAAYETGNLLGGALGLEALAGGGTRPWALLLGTAAAALLWTGSYRAVERILVGLVALMAAVFVTTAIALFPAVPELLDGLFVPGLPGEGAGALLVAVGLIGTTVVPYNLFLHASAVRERWDTPERLPAARLDAAVSILVGGAASMAVVITAASAVGGEDIVNAADMAVQLEPVLGRWARGFFAFGLLAAGLTSAVTAPLAAAYAAAGVLGWQRDLRSARFRAVWMVVLASGMFFVALDVRPVPAILFAQVANGLLLPAVAAFLLLAANDRKRMGRWRNGFALNLLGGVVVLVTLVLGFRAVTGALGS